jgi:HEAT repeat protein
MDTPTSQAQTKQPSISLEQCLSQLAAGTFAYGQLAAFSDLSRERLRQVEAGWSKIEVATRRRLIAEAIELAEENVQYQFGRLCRFALSDPDAEVRQLAITGLWEDESDSLLRELIDVARQDESSDVRAAAVALVGDAIERLKEHDPEVDALDAISDLVLEYAEDERQPTLVRRRAVEAVGALEQDNRTREAILNAFEHGDQTLEAGALVAMGRSLEGRWRTVVRSVLRSEDAELRFEAARALGLIGTADDIPELSELTLEDDTDVRQAAIAAIGEIGGAGAVRVLRNLANESDGADQEAIADALDSALLASEPLRMPR